jgi:predicted Zn-dependent peptidase
MRNLREEKGYTYGIFSHIQPWLNAGAWYIATSVKKEHAQQAYEEIIKEIVHLQEVPANPTTLTTFKNYLVGQLLISFDGLFSIMNKLTEVTLHGLPLHYYQNLLKAIQNLEATTVQAMAQKYFAPTKLCQVMVGGDSLVV